MNARNFWYLTRRNVRLRRARWRVARVGVAAAAFFLALGLGGAMGLIRWLRPALDQLFPERVLVIRPPVMDVWALRLQGPKIDAAALERLRALPGVERISPLAPVTFPLHARGRLPGIAEPMVTEIALHGVSREMVADGLSEGESFEWDFTSGRPCPVVVSSYFLDLYNLGLAESYRLPRLSEAALRGRHFELVLGESAMVGPGPEAGGRTRVVPCVIAGLSRDPLIAGVAAPLSAVQAFDEWYYGERRPAAWSALRVELRSVEFLEAVAQSAREMGLAAQAPGEALRRWRGALRGGVAFACALGGVILGLALMNVAGAFALALAERREELGLLLALGATRRLARRLLLAEALWISLGAAAAGALAAWAAGWGATAFLARAAPPLATLEALTLTPPPGALAAVILGVPLLSALSVWPVLRRALNRSVNEILRGDG